LQADHIGVSAANPAIASVLAAHTVIYRTPGHSKIWHLYFAKVNAIQGERKMRTMIGIAALFAIGLIWSIAVMSELVPVVSAQAATSHSQHNHSTR
jgi:hypothetical protein